MCWFSRPVVATVRMYTHYGKPDLQREVIQLLTLKEEKQVVYAGSIFFE